MPLLPRKKTLLQKKLPTRHNKTAAKLAWQRTIDFFNKYFG